MTTPHMIERSLYNIRSKQIVEVQTHENYPLCDINFDQYLLQHRTGTQTVHIAGYYPRRAWQPQVLVVCWFATSEPAYLDAIALRLQHG